MSQSEAVEGKVREIRRRTRRKYSAEEKIRIVLDGLRGDESIAELYRQSGMWLNLAAAEGDKRARENRDIAAS